MEPPRQATVCTVIRMSLPMKKANFFIIKSMSSSGTEASSSSFESSLVWLLKAKDVMSSMSNFWSSCWLQSSPGACSDATMHRQTPV